MADKPTGFFSREDISKKTLDALKDAHTLMVEREWYGCWFHKTEKGYTFHFRLTPVSHTLNHSGFWPTLAQAIRKAIKDVQ